VSPYSLWLGLQKDEIHEDVIVIGRNRDYFHGHFYR